MKPAVVSLEIQRGTDWSQRFTWKSGGQPVNLTGFTARMQVRPAVNSPQVLLDLSTDNGRIVLGATANAAVVDRTLGGIRLTLPHSVTKSIWWTSGVYDLELVTSAGKVIRLFGGQITINPDVTR